MLRVIDKGVFGFNLIPMARQFLYLFAAFLGCQVGYIIITWITMGNEKP